VDIEQVDDLNDLGVLMGLARIGGRQVVTDYVPQPWPHATRNMPEPAPAADRLAPARAPRGATTIDPTTLAEHPWLAQWQAQGAQPKRSRPSTEQAEQETPMADAGEATEGLEDTLAEAVLLRAFEGLRHAREELDQEAARDVTPDFKLSVLGGQWTFQRTGREYDYYLAACAHKASESFATNYYLGRSSRYAVATYGDMVASAMARGWCHRMQHYYNIFAAQDDAQFLFTEADDASYTEPAEVTELATSATGRLAQRVAELRSIKPRAPSVAASSGTA